MLPQPSTDTSAHHVLRVATQNASAALRVGDPLTSSQALAEVAAACRRLQDWPRVEATLEAALAWARLVGSNDLVVDLLCELCEAGVRTAELQEEALDNEAEEAFERARGHAFEASVLAGRVAEGGWEVTVLLRISDALNRCGDHDDAVLLQTRALRLMSPTAAGGLADPCLLPGPGRLADC